MTPVDLTSAVAAEHTRDLTRTADRSRLAALASCCRPSTWRRGADQTVGVVRRIAAAVRPTRPTAAASCCGGL